MQSNTAKATAAAIALVVAVALFLVLRDDGGDEEPATPAETETTREAPQAQQRPEPPPKPSVPVVRIRNGQPVGGVREAEFDQGDRVRFRVVSDVADEIHVHGYDISRDVAAGGSVLIDFQASIAGIYEAELEARGEHIVELRINP